MKAFWDTIFRALATLFDVIRSIPPDPRGR